MKKYNVKLTYSQIRSLIEFIEIYFIDSLRDDIDIDSIDYVVDMIDALKSLRAKACSATDEELKTVLGELKND